MKGWSQWYKSINTPPWTSRWDGSRKGAAKHAASVLEVGGRGQRELGENVSKHIISRAPDNADGALLDEISNVVVLDVDVFGLRGSHVVGRKSDASLVVLKGGSRANDGKTNDGKKQTEKHGMLRRRSKSYVFGLGCRESNAFLESTAPRDMTTRHHGDEASTRAAIDAIGEGRVLPYERLQRDKTGR